MSLCRPHTLQSSRLSPPAPHHITVSQSKFVLNFCSKFNAVDFNQFDWDHFRKLHKGSEKQKPYLLDLLTEQIKRKTRQFDFLDTIDL